MSGSPCYKNGQDCPKRAPRCHGSCPDYMKYRAEKDAELMARHYEEDVKAVGMDYRIKMKLQYMKKNRR